MLLSPLASTRAIILFSLALSMVSCGSSENDLTALDTRMVTLPDGFAVRAEVRVTPEDMARGMMYRDSLPDGKGMLFAHASPGKSPYWMANCKIPLDIIWMTPDHKVVEISSKTPPCPSGGSDCPNYGGHVPSQYVLELGAGQASVHHVMNGAVLHF